MLQEVLSDSHPPPVEGTPWAHLSRDSTFVSFLGGNVTKVTHLQTPETAAWSHVQDMQRCHLECWVKVSHVSVILNHST